MSSNGEEEARPARETWRRSICAALSGLEAEYCRQDVTVAEAEDPF